jgi:hypothetical protein
MAGTLDVPPKEFMTPKRQIRRSEPGTPYSPALPLDFGTPSRVAREAQEEEEFIARANRGLVTPNRPTRKNVPGAPKKKGGIRSALSRGGRTYKFPRKMSRKYCKRTSCKKMGFTQKASCRPWKNCY